MALNNIKSWTAAGWDALHVAHLAPSGFMAGWANLTAADTNTGSGMRRLKGAQTMPALINDTNKVPIPGDNGRIRTFTFENADPTQGLLEMGVTDIEAEVEFEGGSVYTLGEWDFRGRGGGAVNLSPFLMLLTRDAYSVDSGEGGNGFENLLVLSTNIKPLDDESRANQAAGKMRYSVVADYPSSGLLPWGVSMQTAFSTTRRLTVPWFSEFRSMLHVFIGDNAETDIVVDYTPINATKTRAIDFATGNALTISSVTPATKTIVLNAAPTSGQIVEVIYECESFD